MPPASTPPSSAGDPGPSLTRGEIERRQRRRTILRVLLGIVVVAGLATCIKPAYRLAEQWRSRTIVAQAEELVRQQLFNEAIEKLETALQLDPANAPALRSLSGIYSRFELPSALPVYRALASLPERTEGDLHAYIAAALRLQRFDLAETELARLLTRTNIGSQTRTQATEYFFRLGDMKRALAFAEQLRKDDPTNNLHHLRVAKILLNMPKPEDHTRALNVLQSLVKPGPVDRLNVLEMLSSAPRLPTDDTRLILDRIPTGPDSSPAEYFLRVEILSRLDPAQRAGLLDQTLARFKGGTPEQQAELILWLNRIGEHQKVLETWRPEDVARNAAPLSAYVEVLHRARRWAELQKLVAQPLPLDPWMLETLRAHAAAELEQKPLAAEHWRRAFDHAGTNPSHLRALGDLAMRLGDTEQAITAFDRLTKNRLHRATGFRRLAQIYERSRQTIPLRATMQAWSASIPDDPVPENAYCYLSALLARDVEDAYARARLLFERQPSRITHRITLAFLELRKNRPREALQYFERALPPGQTPPPQAALVQAMILDANGRAAQARDLVKDLKPESLLPEEQELLRKVRGGA